MLSWDEPSTSSAPAAPQNRAPGRLPETEPRLAAVQPAAPPMANVIPMERPAGNAAQQQGPVSNPQGPVSNPDSVQARDTGRVRAEDKRIINGASDVNQLVPFQIQMGLGKIPCDLREPLDAAGSEHEPRH